MVSPVPPNFTQFCPISPNSIQFHPIPSQLSGGSPLSPRQQPQFAVTVRSCTRRKEGAHGVGGIHHGPMLAPPVPDGSLPSESCPLGHVGTSEKKASAMK